MEYRELSKEKQKLSEVLSETKKSLEERINQVTKLDKEVKEQKEYLKKNKRFLEEVSKLAGYLIVFLKLFVYCIYIVEVKAAFLEEKNFT